MHLDTFIPAFLLFTALSLILPIVLSGVAEKGRLKG